MRYFDTHAHLGLIDDDPIKQLLITQEARQHGVMRILSICNNLLDFAKVYGHLKTANNVYFAAGVSPSEVQNPGKDWAAVLKQNAQLPKVVAIGEIGLDYFHKFGDKTTQVELFIQQLDIAGKLGLPVIIHNREAGRDVLDILRDRLPSRGGVLHCYSENAEYAKKASKLDIYFSFAGNLTYKNAKNLHESVNVIPRERILIESESPFMVPSEFRGKRNMPKYINLTARRLSEMLSLSEEEMSEILWENSCRFFGLPLD
ncbi:MAG: TatD family hydrolase [Spirochaetaceae bacterium]|jgi:TatD DNase family protein|nr:TatD family hydrolase [Spirochaetaceae bacterium]